MSSQLSSQINNQQQQNYLQQRKQQLTQGLIIPRSMQELNKFDQRKFGVTISSGFIGPIKNNKYLESQHFMFYINLLNHVYRDKRILAFDFYVFCDFMPNLVKETQQYSQKQKEQMQFNQRRLEINRNIQMIQQTIETNYKSMEQSKERIDYYQQDLAILMSSIEENHIFPSNQEFYSVWGNKDDVSTVKSTQSQIIKASQQEQNQQTKETQLIQSDVQIKKNITIASIQLCENNSSQDKSSQDLLKAGIITGDTNHELNQTQIEQGASEPTERAIEVEQQNQKIDNEGQIQIEKAQFESSQANSEPTNNSELLKTQESSVQENSQLLSQNQDQSQQKISNIAIQSFKIDEETKKENERAARQGHINQIQQQIAELEQQLIKMQNDNNQNQSIIPILQQELFNIVEQLKRIQQEINYLSYDQKKLNEAMKDTMREFRYQTKDQFLTKSDKFYFPINLNNNHWISIVVDTVRGRIFYLDSLSRNYRQDIVYGLYQIFQNYLDLDITQYKIESDSPQQQNAFDCGIFALLALLYTYQSTRPKLCEMRDIYQYSQTLVSEYRKRVLVDIAIIASQKNEFQSSDLEFIIENEL